MESTPLPRGEHEEFRKTIEAKFEVLTAEDKRLNERLKAVEGVNKQLTDMNVTLQKQADNIGEMNRNIANLTKAREDDTERLEKLENRDGEMWRKVVSYSITAVISIVLGFIFAQIGF
ncbi:MAG: hypothetical protein LUD19_03370 [Clostridia bacterium]|nr:hypothetical protein [Clostridia bacterium]